MYEKLLAQLEADVKAAGGRVQDLERQVRAKRRELQDVQQRRSRAEVDLKEKQAGLLWVQSKIKELAPNDREGGLFATNGASDFPRDGTNIDKIEFVLRKIGRFAHKSQIEEELNAIEPQASENWYSNNLSLATRKGQLERINYNDSFNYYFYGLSEWVEEMNGERVLKSTKYAPSDKYLEGADLETMEFK